MARLGLGRQHRRVPHGRGGFVHTPWFILCVCLVGAILLTVLVGNILRLTLSEEVYNRLTQGEPETEPEVIKPAPVKVKKEKIEKPKKEKVKKDKKLSRKEKKDERVYDEVGSIFKTKAWRKIWDKICLLLLILAFLVPVGLLAYIIYQFFI